MADLMAALLASLTKARAMQCKKKGCSIQRGEDPDYCPRHRRADDDAGVTWAEVHTLDGKPVFLPNGPTS